MIAPRRAISGMVRPAAGSSSKMARLAGERARELPGIFAERRVVTS